MTFSHCLVSQRFLLEIFFLRVIEKLSRRDSINSTSFTMEYFPNCFNSKGRKLFNPSKSAIENLLRRDSSVWTVMSGEKDDPNAGFEPRTFCYPGRCPKPVRLEGTSLSPTYDHSRS